MLSNVYSHSKIHSQLITSRQYNGMHITCSDIEIILVYSVLSFTGDMLNITCFLKCILATYSYLVCGLALRLPKQIFKNLGWKGGFIQTLQASHLPTSLGSYMNQNGGYY